MWRAEVFAISDCIVTRRDDMHVVIQNAFSRIFNTSRHAIIALCVPENMSYKPS